MTTNWESFMKRRNIDLSQFLTVNGIRTRVELLAHLSKIGVEPPDEVLIESLFPTPPPIVLKLEPVEQQSFAPKEQPKVENINKPSKPKNKNS